MDKSMQGTEIKELMPIPSSTWRARWQHVKTLFFNTWSATNLGQTDMSAYAENLMLKETRKGIVTMSVLTLLTQIAAVVLYYRFNFHESFFIPADCLHCFPYTLWYRQNL